MYVSVDPATAGRVFDIGMIDGSIEALDARRGPRRRRRGRRAASASATRSTSSSSTARPHLTVQGIYTEQDLAGPFVVSHALHEQSGTDQFDFSVYVDSAAA